MNVNFYKKFAVYGAVRKLRSRLSYFFTRAGPHRGQMIVEHYKGAEIRIRAMRFGHHAWQCKICIHHSRRNGLRSISATVTATESGISKQMALSAAFMEAMTLCDATQDKNYQASPH
jgi:hypothetical protein